MAIRIRLKLFWVITSLSLLTLATLIYMDGHREQRTTDLLQQQVRDRLETYQSQTFSLHRELEVTKPNSILTINGVSPSRMEERRRLISTVCRLGSNLTSQLPKVKSVLHNSKYGFYYCPVEKVASTFWRRFTYQLNHTHPVRSPFDVGIVRAFQGLKMFHLTRKQQFGEGLQQVLSSSTKLLFVRDPHSRLFSAFVDKLLAPNPYFWKVWATPAIVHYRQNHHQRVRSHAHCGHDITFPEFVTFVLNIASNNDGHVMPINSMCTPCAVSYTVIGKMESFMEDFKMLLGLIHVNSTSMRFESMRQETVDDAIVDSVTDALSGSWLSLTLKCITKEEVLQRLWRKNQIRGFISWKRNMKLSAKEIQVMNSIKFIQLLKEANKLSTNKDELKLQKMQAMKEAFFVLDRTQLEAISKIYSDDFNMFGYDPSPSWLEGIQKVPLMITHAFDYSKNWDLSSLV